MKEYAPISTWEGAEVQGELSVRVIQISSRIFLDIREKTWPTGTQRPESGNFTSKGIRLMLKDIAKLKKLLPIAEAEITTRLLLEKGVRDRAALYEPKGEPNVQSQEGDSKSEPESSG